MNYCTNCGKKLENDAKFCVSCGKQVNGTKTLDLFNKKENKENEENKVEKKISKSKKESKVEVKAEDNEVKIEDTEIEKDSVIEEMPIENVEVEKVVKDEDEVLYTSGDKFLYILLGFFLPLVGLILFFMWIDTKNRDGGKNALKGALIKLGFWFIVLVTFFINMINGGTNIVDYFKNNGSNNQTTQTNPNNWDNFA